MRKENSEQVGEKYADTVVYNRAMTIETATVTPREEYHPEIDLGPDDCSIKIFKMKKFLLCGIGFCLIYCFICII